MTFVIELTHHFLTLRISHPVERYPVAYAGIRIEMMDGVRTGVLCGMMRYPEFKGEGICRMLVEKRIDICKELNCGFVYSAVYNKRKGLIKLYKSLGFEEIDSLSPEYSRFMKKVQ